MFIFNKKHTKTSLLPEFVINIFLDTNILVSIIDKSYEALSKAADTLRDCMFTNLVSSTYVIYEFVGVRKREHYLREIFYKSQKSDTNGNIALSDLNLSDLLLYKGDFDSKLVPYDSVEEKIQIRIGEELEQIVRDFGIDYDTYKIHNSLFSPIKDLVLTTRISKEDSFVLCSAFWPDGEERTRNMLFLTHDTKFVTSYEKARLDKFIEKYSIEPHTVHDASSTKEIGLQLKLTSPLDDALMQTQLSVVVLGELIKQNKNKYLGKTNAPPPRGPNNIICFDLVPDTILPANLILVIVAKDLSFCFIMEHSVNSIRDRGTTITFPYSSPTEKDLCMELNLESEGLNDRYGAHQETAITLLRQPGHLIFLHPDL